MEGLNRSSVLASLDGLSTEPLHGTAGIQSVQLFLCLHRSQGRNDLLLQHLVLEAIAFDALGNVLEELGEVVDFEDLVEAHEL